MGKLYTLVGAFCLSMGLYGVTTGKITIWAALVAILGGAFLIIWPYWREIRRDWQRPYSEE